MQATENVDTVYLTTLLDQLNQIRNGIAQVAINEKPRMLISQLIVRISKNVLDMSKQEAADDSEMPLGPIAARAHRIEDEVAY